MKSETTAKLFGALAKAQSEMKAVQFDAVNPFLKNKFASLGAVIQTSRATLAKHGLAVSQMPTSGEKTVGVETILAHESGEWIGSTISLPLGEEKGKSQAQLAGSVITYLRRYSLAGILGMYADEDGDGNGPPTVPNAPPARRDSPARPTPPRLATTDQRAKMLTRLLEAGFSAKTIQEFAVKTGLILSTESAEADWPLDLCATDKATMAAILDRVKKFTEGGESSDNVPY
jgi:hypothetical protein